MEAMPAKQRRQSCGCSSRGEGCTLARPLAPFTPSSSPAPQISLSADSPDLRYDTGWHSMQVGTGGESGSVRLAWVWLLTGGQPGLFEDGAGWGHSVKVPRVRCRSSPSPLLQGTSSRMEDRVLALDLSRHPHFSACQRAVLMAVLDGHAGSAAAAYLEVRGTDVIRSTNINVPRALFLLSHGPGNAGIGSAQRYNLPNAARLLSCPP